MKDGGPAFPIEDALGASSLGITIRDYFAAAAMQGLIATNPTARDNIEPSPENLSIAAYRVSDAMLKERERKP